MRQHLFRRLAVALGLLSAMVSQASAADWPVRPVRIIAPSSAGGAADTFARLLTEQFAEQFKERFFVENRAGAGGLIGAQVAARADPDGYTLVTSSIGYHVIAPAMSGKAGFDPLKDFTHIAFLGGPPNVLVVNPKLGVKTFQEFLALAKRGDTLDYVSPGVGSHGHLVSEYFAESAGIKLLHVPHKGAAPAMLDLIAGNVKLGTMTWTSAAPQIRAGKIVPLAVSSNNRIPEYPDVPTFRELGYPNIVTTTWYALSAPSKLPADIIQKLSAAVIKMLANPIVQKKYADDAIEVTPMSPDEIAHYMESEIVKWGPVAKKLGQM